MAEEELRVAAVVPKRSGLGRGFGSLLQTATDETAPAHLHGIADNTAGLWMAITETATGTVIEVSDATRRSATARSTWTDAEMRSAVVEAVASLLDHSTVTLVSAAIQTVEGSDIASVLLETEDGRRVAGSEVVRGTVAYAMARATQVALLGAQR